jgi:hypothetical protein
VRAPPRSSASLKSDGTAVAALTNVIVSSTQAFVGVHQLTVIAFTGVGGIGA